MPVMMSRGRKSALAFPFSALVVLSLSSLTALASYPQTWAVIGAAGIADESSTSLISLSDTGSVSIKASVVSARAQLRYPIVPVGDMLKTRTEMAGQWALGVVYRDTGATARVIVTVKSVNLATGAVRTYATFDSNAVAEFGDQYFRGAALLHAPGGTAPLESFLTYTEAYYADVQLIKTDSTGNPGVKAIQILNLLNTCAGCWDY
jgi:hypothetical protein